MRVVLDHITKKFGDFTAVSEFSAVLEDGELVSLLGPSGCGKSTLLNMLSGILPVSGGKIFFDDQDVTAMPPEKRGIGLVFQNYALYPHMTVMGNICFPLETQKVPKAERIERANEIAKLVHVDMLMNRKPSELSGGQQQRVAIARALVKNPRLLLLDEPLSNLDARLRLEMREEIRRIQQRTGVTTIFVTHDQEEALSISDRIVLMRSGILQQNDLPQRLYNEPANQFVADFLGNPPINNIPGTIQNGLFVTEDGKAEAKLPMLEGVENGRKVNFSVRSESFVLDEKGPIACEVTRMYQMGKEEMAYLRMGGHDFRAYIDADAGLKAGDHVRLGFKKRGVFLFDRETGERIR
mgnify:FL=1